MKIRYIIEPYDYLAFQIYHTTNSSFYRKIIRLTKIIPCAFFVTIPIVFSFTTQTNPYLTFIIFICIAIIWYIAYPYLASFFIRLRLSRMIRKGNMFTAELYILSFTDTGITETHQGMSSSVPWNKIHHIAQTKSHIFIYFNPISAIIVPKHALKSKEEELYFREKLLNQEKYK